MMSLVIHTQHTILFARVSTLQRRDEREFDVGISNREQHLHL
jgi:hypothetical protein